MEIWELQKLLMDTNFLLISTKMPDIILNELSKFDMNNIWTILLLNIIINNNNFLQTYITTLVKL